ncbi:hypothetical protein AVEN_78636-1 [Araneus ventricosus]|uniref:Uncharacterized protein n=1 Tax=Araneus ventricosus TaxID=182803 RepID=A0A4Y2KBW8_ARAVE|nr:hypothetical protein AVEN_78636-1 [Araneus ventricosus]
MTQHHAPCGADCDVKHLPWHFAIVCSSTISRRCHLSTERRSSTLRKHCSFLDATFPQRWIGRGAVMAWPPRYPDITPLDFYLWGYVKQHVYSARVNDINHLKQRITDVIHSVTPDVLTRVWEEPDYPISTRSCTILLRYTHDIVRYSEYRITS